MTRNAAAERIDVCAHRACRTVRIPAGGTSGRHTLVVGATGSGKTVTQAWIAGRLIEAGHVEAQR